MIPFRAKCTDEDKKNLIRKDEDLYLENKSVFEENKHLFDEEGIYIKPNKLEIENYLDFMPAQLQIRNDN